MFYNQTYRMRKTFENRSDIERLVKEMRGTTALKSSFPEFMWGKKSLGVDAMTMLSYFQAVSILKVKSLPT